MRAVSERGNDFTLPCNRPTRPHRPISRGHREYCAIRLRPFIFGLDFNNAREKIPRRYSPNQINLPRSAREKFKREAVDREVR